MYTGLHFDAVAAGATTVFAPTDAAATAAASKLHESKLTMTVISSPFFLLFPPFNCHFFISF